MERREKRGLYSAIHTETAKEIEALVGPAAAGSIDLEAVETAARRSALLIAARTLEHRLNADLSDNLGPGVPCPRCTGKARFVGRRVKTFVGVLGPLRLERAYCGTGFCPRDEALGLPQTTLTAAVTRMVGAAGAAVAFEEGRQLLEELAAVRLDAKTVERVAEALGRQIAQDEKGCLEEGSPSAPTLYLGMDGTGIPMRKEELTGRPGKQPDGSAKTREVKLATVWSAEKRDERGMAVRDKGSVTDSAAIESAASPHFQDSLSDFAQRTEREASRHGFSAAPRRVVLGDGAAWIWNIADSLFPGAIQTVDRFHVKQHLSEAATAIWGPDSHLGRLWADERCDELDYGRLDDLIGRPLCPCPPL